MNDQMKQKIYINLDPKLKEKLERIAKQNRRSLSNMIEVLISEYKE